jgi:hypothetical protein
MGSEKEARKKVDEARKREAEERQRRINEQMFREYMRRRPDYPWP